MGLSSVCPFLRRNRDGKPGPNLSVSLDSVNATYNPVEINVGKGTQGIFIDRGLLRYNNPMSGGFYGRCHSSFENSTPKLSIVRATARWLLQKFKTLADMKSQRPACETTLLYGPTIQLFYRPKVMEIPLECGGVDLVIEQV